MDLEFLIRKLSILTKDLLVEQFDLNWAQLEYLEVAQRQLLETGKIRIIVLKARQLGISTVTEALIFTLCFLYDNYKAIVIAHEAEASQNLLAMTNRYWETYPFKDMYSLKYAGKNHLQWNETKSGIHVATAGNKAVGRSATIHACHASEVAFWPDPEIVMLGLRQTIPSTPGTLLVLESTANGMGNYFHKTWLDAEAGDSEFVPLFFPWHKHPEYMASFIQIPFDNMGKLDSEEKELRGMGISDDRLMWRRYAIRDLCQGDLLKFKQEYPATPMEAFIASGTNIFPHTELAMVYAPEPGVKGVLYENAGGVVFKPMSDGPLTVWKGPSSDPDYGQYYVAGDPTHSTRGDFAVAQVINRRTLEQVAEWRGRIDPVGFADVLFLLGYYYNVANLSTEIEGPGYGTIGALVAKNYPKIYKRSRPDATPGKFNGEQNGWSTTAQSKQLMIGRLLNVVVNHEIVIHSHTLYNEMRSYVRLENGGYGPITGNGREKGYDDTVMAMAQAVICHIMDSPVQVYGEMSKDAGNTVESVNAVVLPWDNWRG